MTLAPPLLDDLFLRMAIASAHAGGIALLVWLVTALAGRRISARWRCALWSLVFVRLLLPALPASPASLLNLAPAGTAIRVATPPLPAGDDVTITYGVIPDAAAAAAPARPEVSTSTVRRSDVTIAWLAVAAALLARRAIGYLLLGRTLRRLAPLCDDRLLGMRAVESDAVTSPGVVGLVRPTLLLPPGLLARLSPDELRFVVLHEAAHLRRGDLIVGAVTTLITTLHWFNPLVWFAASRFRAEREMACDEVVLAATPDRRAYGETVLRLLELAAHPQHPAGVAGVLSSDRRTLRRRIALIAAAAPQRFAPLGPAAFALIALPALTGPRHRAGAVEPPVAAPATTATVARESRDTVTRVYDVRDLIIDIPDFTFSPELHGWPEPTTLPAAPLPAAESPHAATPTPRPTPAPASAPAATAATTTAADDVPDHVRAERVRKLMADITGTVDPMSWRDNTGTLGSIRELSGQLIVTQTPANHERILAKLDALRGARGVQVQVEARFISGIDDAVEAALGGRWPARAARASHDLWPRFLDQADVDRVFRASQQDRDATTITPPRITLFNGQRAYVLVSRQTAYVADLVRAADKNGAESFEPVIKVLPTGTLLDARATIVTDDDGGQRYVTLMLGPRVSTLLDFVPQPWPGAPAGSEKQYTVQVPHTQVTRLETTVTIPDGQTALYRLYPVRSPPAATATTRPGDAKAPGAMLLLVRATVIEPRDAERKMIPPPSSRPSPGAAVTPRPAAREGQIVVEPGPAPRQRPPRATRPLDSPE